jgi:hypothetical protein
MIESLSATCVRANIGSPLDSRLHTNTDAVFR